MDPTDRLCGRRRWLVTVALAPTLACSNPIERDTRSALDAVERELAPPSDAEPSPDPPAATRFDGTLPSYLAYAFAHSPGLRASFEDWRAASLRPRQERRMPEPTLTYAGFVRSVETRVGPQRHRIGAMQWFPWPTKLTAGAQAASLEARAAQRRFEAHALAIAAEVTAAYWALWRVQRRREVLHDEVEVLASLSEQIRARLEVGGADVADLAQLDLEISRQRDRLAGIDEHERIASARLVRVLGAPDGTETPVASNPPPVADLDEPIEALTAEASEHPRVTGLHAMSDAAVQRRREVRADRFPSVGLGVDWIMTGQSPAATPPPDSGKDAVAVAVSLRVPLWAPAYRAAEDETRAHEAAMRARALDARNGLMAAVREQAARVDDDLRRVRVHETTLLPQAQTAFESVLGSYAAGRASVAELLLAERALLGLRDELYGAQADYGTHLAQLESAVGRPVRTKGADDAGR